MTVFDPSAAAVAVAPAAIDDLTGDYQLDSAHTRIGFVARHAMVTKVRGTFQDWDATVHLDAQEPSKSSATARLRAASVDTGNETRDAHLRTNDFFDAPTYPEIVFTSTKVEQPDDETFRMTGDLTIKDVTRPVTVDFTYVGSAKDPFGNLRAGFEGTAVINRKDWNVTWNTPLETGGFLVSDRVTLEFDVSAIKLNATP